MKRLLLIATVALSSVALSGCVVVPARGYYAHGPHYGYY